MKKTKQYYKIHIDPEDILTEEELHEQVYGNRKLTPFENIGLELSYGYFNYWLVLIIVIISLITGILIGSFDASRRFNLPVSEVLSLNPAKSELAISSVDYSRESACTDIQDLDDERLSDKINLDGFSGTINLYYGDVQIGDTIEGSYSPYINRDNQYVDTNLDDSTMSDRLGDSKKNEDDVNYETTQLVDDSQSNDIDNHDSNIVDNSESYPQKIDDVQKNSSDTTINKTDNTYNDHEKQIVLNINKVSSLDDTTPESYSDTEDLLTVGASDQDIKDNTIINEELPLTRPSELDEHPSDECIIGASSVLNDNFDGNTSDESDNINDIPLWCEVFKNLFYVLIILVIILWCRKHYKKI